MFSQGINVYIVYQNTLILLILLSCETCLHCCHLNEFEHNRPSIAFLTRQITIHDFSTYRNAHGKYMSLNSALLENALGYTVLFR